MVGSIPLGEEFGRIWKLMDLDGGSFRRELGGMGVGEVWVDLILVVYWCCCGVMLCQVYRLLLGLKLKSIGKEWRVKGG